MKDIITFILNLIHFVAIYEKDVKRVWTRDMMLRCFFFSSKEKKNPCFSTSRICTMLHPLIIVPLSTCLTARGLNRGSAGNYSTPPHPPACGVSTIILLLQSRLEPMGNQSVNIKHWMLDGQSRFFFFPVGCSHLNASNRHDQEDFMKNSDNGGKKPNMEWTIQKDHTVTHVCSFVSIVSEILYLS